MNCIEMREMLSLYMDNELNEEQIKNAENHLRNCEACKSEYNELKQLRDMLENLEDVPVPIEFDERLRSAIYSEIEKQKNDNTIEENQIGRKKSNRKEKINYRRIFSIIAIFVIGIFTVFLYNNNDALFPNNDELNISEEVSDKIVTKEADVQDNANVQENANVENFIAENGKNFGLEIMKDADSKKSVQDENTLDSTANISDATTPMESEALILTEEDGFENPSTIVPQTVYKGSSVPNQENQGIKTDIDSKLKAADEKAFYEELIKKELFDMEYQITKIEKQENNSWLFIIEINQIDKDGNKAMEIRTYKGENGALSWIKD